jgi:hypothetical protein
MTTFSNVFVSLSEKEWKSFLITENAILLSSKDYKNATEMLEGIEKKSMISLTKNKEIALNTLEKLTHLEDSDTLTIHHEGKSLSLEFDDAAKVTEIAQVIAQMRQFTRNQGTQTPFSAMQPALIGLGVTGGLTWLIYTMASDIEAGGVIDTSGRRSLYKKIFAWFAETLGTMGTLALGGFIGALCLYLMYRAYQNPSNEYVYS